jgi:hypothetical protein
MKSRWSWVNVWSGRSRPLDEAGAIDLCRRMEADGTWTDLVLERDNSDRGSR